MAKNNGTDMTKQGETQVAYDDGINEMLGQSSIEDIQKDLKSGQYEAAPQIFKIPEGGFVSGILEGYGPVAELTDPSTREVKEVNTWIIKSKTGNARISILSSAQLDKKLPGFIGSVVKIHRGQEVRQGNGRMLTEYVVYGEKRPDGRPRSWSAQSAQTPQLPAGR